ncbi:MULTISPECIES: TolC family protein [unclassified Mesorhizobium]|uniref:TolC family protein n=1 Tax=unclassified Mesorhizobium TaxID=325217 RepID=UPI001129DBC6|nr:MULTISPECIES: TolC family protein [unclassified Mesorhizobium]TPK51719.1 channel protein TolC [Mesorhizobium sp. B2-5-2]TPL30677.1 channel protein TolC [Mesorhizobium sp. B2-4-7]TPL44995.1 channel protein TolC [Mesorhizobium sp. B2-4-5]TPM76415.1 channel protein TolC [Mesorhizobium sp. B2-1-6]TPN76187.1 channel protein TolC [Mesorhizobium sp. B1-1-2]
MNRTGMSAIGKRLGLLMAATMLTCGGANALTLKEAVAVAVESNPEIGQAIENREAIEFELRQAKGLYLPSVDLQASAGARRLDNSSRRALSIEDDALYPAETDLTVSQTLYDSGARRAELNRQASRVDGASFRVLERSEFIGLSVVQDYLEYMLQASIVAEAKKNLGFHQAILHDIQEGIAGGGLNEADRQQAEERLFAAKARMQEASEELEAARIRFFKTVGKPLTNAARPADVSGTLPRSLDDALGLARESNPRVHMANSDIAAAASLVDAARAKYGPSIIAEGSARAGYDIDGDNGDASDLQARLVLRWNLYRGGIDKANEQEQIRRTSEQRLAMHQVLREIEEAVRTSWDRRFRQADLAKTLKLQAVSNEKLVASYREQFKVGQRSLLDVLDAQNTRFNTATLAETASYASLFAQYRLLAATGQLLKTMDVHPPKQATAYARTEFAAPETADTETYARTPSEQKNDVPFDILAPVRKK